MSRALSANAVVALNSLQTGAAWFFLIEIAHPDLDATMRFVNNTENVINIKML